LLCLRAQSRAAGDASTGWREIVPQRYWPADLSHLPDGLVKRIQALPDDRGLYLWGPQGAGKTYAAAAAAKHYWTAGHDIAWQPYEELLLMLRDTYRNGGGSEWALIAPLCRADVLLLDDVGVTVSGDTQESDHSLRTLLVVLDHRLAHCRRIFVTSNKSVEDLGKSFDGRIASRLCQACDVLKITGPDRRMDLAGGGQ
jgi:DNA replication protein DnaC